MASEEVLINVSMAIILHAGDARNLAAEALEEAKKNHFSKADSLLSEAKEKIVLAHNSQTKIIQEEAAGKHFEVPLLFIHAQDTLMTITSELNLTREMINMYRLFFNGEENNK